MLRCSRAWINRRVVFISGAPCLTSGDSCDDRRECFLDSNRGQPCFLRMRGVRVLVDGISLCGSRINLVRLCHSGLPGIVQGRRGYCARVMQQYSSTSGIVGGVASYLIKCRRLHFVVSALYPKSVTGRERSSACRQQFI